MQNIDKVIFKGKQKDLVIKQTKMHAEITLTLKNASNNKKVSCTQKSFY